MSQHEAEQQGDEEATDAPEAAAGDEAPEAEVDSGDAEMADTVGERAGELTGSGADTAGSDGDPISEAEAHLETVDMDAERKKVQDLADTL